MAKKKATTRKKVTPKKPAFNRVSLKYLKERAIENSVGRGTRKRRDWDADELETINEMVEWVEEGNVSLTALRKLIKENIQAGTPIQGIGLDRAYSAVCEKLSTTVKERNIH